MLTCGDVRFKIRRRPGRHGYATGDHWKWRNEACPRTDYDRGSGEPVRGSLFFLLFVFFQTLFTCTPVYGGSGIVGGVEFMAAGRLRRRSSLACVVRCGRSF